MVMVCAVIYLLESQDGGLLRARDFLFEQFGICLYDSGSVGFLPDRVFQDYVAHGIQLTQRDSPAVSWCGGSEV